MYLSCFWAYVRQPHNHIGWAKPMPFTLLNSTNRRTNLSNFHEKTLRIGGAGKWGFFRVGHYLIFFFQKRKSFFCFISMKTSSPFISGTYNLFLHYGWFLQNLGKDFIRTNMHTTVPFQIMQRSPWKEENASINYLLYF